MPSLLGAKLAVARGAGALAKLGGGGATSLPGRVLMALEPQAIGTLGARLPRGSAVISATNGKTTTAAMAAGILAEAGIPLVHNQAGANMAGGVATTLLDATRGREIAGELGLFEVDELWLASVAAALAPRAIVLGNLFRDQLDRFGELEAIADSWAQLLETLARARDPQRRRSAARRPRARARARRARLLRRRGRHARAPRAGPRRRCEALPALRQPLRLRRRLPRPSRPLPLPHLRRDAPYAAGARERGRPAGRAKRRVHAHDPGRRARVWSSPCRASTTSTTRSPPRRSASRSRCRSTRSSPDSQATRPAFGRAETAAPRRARSGERPRRGRRAGAADPARQEPRRRQRGAAHARARARASTTCSACSTTRSPTAATSRGSGTPTSSCSPTASRSAVCSGSRAADLAARLKYAGVEPEPDHDRARPAAGARRGRRAHRARRPLYALPTYTAMLALRELLVARGAARGRWS